MLPSSRDVFRQAAGFFVTTVALVEHDQWDRPGLGQWSVRDLTGHASRALITVETYLGRHADAVETPTAADYFLKVGSRANPEEVARRGREAGAALADDPAQAVREIADRVLGLVAETDDAQLVGSPAGGMRLSDYLETRAFELVVHTLDLAAAIGARVEPPPEAVAASLNLATTLAHSSGNGPDLLLALTGRRPLPTGFSLV